MSTAAAQKAAVDKFRSWFLNAPRTSMLQQQELTARGSSFRGPFRTEQVSVPAPNEQDLCEQLWEVVSDMRMDGETIDKPHYAQVLGGEWTDPLTASPPQMPGRESGPSCVMLYFHGGSYNSGSPAAARPIVTNLCKRNRSRAFAPQYRLGPQHTFPAQLLDALVAYFYLVAPPPGASHQAISPSSVVFVGESAGASLVLAMLQTLLHIRRKQSGYTPMLPFHDREISIDLPAGCAILSVVGDWTFSLPSSQHHADTDILIGEPWLQPDFPPDTIWPTEPPRGEAFCFPTALCHPLISPALCRDWTGAPPMSIYSGEETLADSMMLIAQTAARQGVSVEFAQYEGMPHVFPWLMRKLPQATHAYDKWAAACTAFVRGEQASGKAAVFGLGELKPHDLDVQNLISLTHDKALEMMKVGRARKTRDVFTGTQKNRPSRM